MSEFVNKRSLKSGFSFFLFTLVFIVFYNLYAAIGPMTKIDVNKNKLILESSDDRIIFQAIADNVIRIDYQPSGIEDPNTLVIDDATWPDIAVTIDTTSDPVIFKSSGLTIQINRNPLRFSAYRGSSLLLKEQGNEGFYKGGLKLDVFAKNYFGITNRDDSSLTTNFGALIAAGSQGGAGAPFIWTNQGWGLVADSDSGKINISSGHLWYRQGRATHKSDIEIFLIAGTPKDIFRGLATVSGRAPLPPKFTFGFMNTEWGIDENELVRDVQTYRTKRIPLDAYILDFDWMDWGADNYGEFRWNPVKFPDGPSGKLKAILDSMDVKLFGIRKPRVHIKTVQGKYIKDHQLICDSVKDYFSGKNAYLLDFRKQATREWFWNSYIKKGNAYNKGIIGYWNDEADVYGGNFMFMQMQRSSYEGQRKYNNRRVWSINRNFYLGAQRYAYALWSGDIKTGFASMAAQRLYMLTSMTAGVPWWGMDIGGFEGTPSAENYYRWIQFGAFVPVFRVHGTYNEEREPWNYGEEAENIVRKYIRLRYELMPYIYCAAWKTHKTGLPMVRPLIMDYPADTSVVNMSDEWLFGDDILVHPIVQKGATKTTVYLPQGQWFDYHSGKKFTGPVTINQDVSASDIPLFVKSGTVIPTSPAGDYVDDPVSKKTIILQCYGKSNGRGLIYDDDGITYNYEKGQYAETELQHQQDGLKAILNINTRKGSFATPVRDYVVDFRFVQNADSVLLDGQKLKEMENNFPDTNNVSGWTYDSTPKSILVRFKDDGKKHIVIAYLKSKPDK